MLKVPSEVEGLRLRPEDRPSLPSAWARDEGRVSAWGRSACGGNLEPFRQCSRPWAKPNGQGAERHVETCGSCNWYNCM